MVELLWLDDEDELEEAAGCCWSEVLCCATAGTISAAAKGNVNSDAIFMVPPKTPGNLCLTTKARVARSFGGRRRENARQHSIALQVGCQTLKG